MKTLLVIPFMVLSIQISGAQGTVNFQNSFETRVIDSTTGQFVPVGSSFLAALYYAHDGIVDESQFIQVGGPANFPVHPGIFMGGARTAPTPEPGDWGMFHVRVWETAFGATYEEALRAPPRDGVFAKVGKSNIIRVNTSHPDQLPLPAELRHFGLAAFEVTPVPEPATMLLIGVALAARFAFSRLKSLVVRRQAAETSNVVPSL